MSDGQGVGGGESGVLVVLDGEGREIARVPAIEGQQLTVPVQRRDGSSFSAEVALVPAEPPARSEAYYRALFEQSPIPKWLYDVDTLHFLAVNDAAVRMYGYSRDEFLSMTLREIRPPEEVPRMLADVKSVRGPSVSTWIHRRKDGSILDVELTSQDFAVGQGRARLVVVQDITERRRLEEQLRQTQKMDAVGKLAGGVAHDFNNLLTVILSCVDFLRTQTPPDDPRASDVDDIRTAARRAAELTRQLLAFSRQTVLAPRYLDMRTVLAGMHSMLARILGDDIELVLVPAKTVCMVHADPGSLEQVIMNLVVNARDALPRGGHGAPSGHITLETRECVLDAAFARTHLGVKGGTYVMLSVRDDGTGMDEATRARIFEPFFTTKEQGQGTGLGLSTVLGIVEQSGGGIDVESAPGAGSDFRVYLPRAIRSTPSRPEMRRVPAARGTESVLLVEDNPQVRVVAREILRRYGYTVFEASGPLEALEMASAHKGKLDLLLTDVVMPLMSGAELAQRLGKQRPDLRILCMSGYTDDTALKDGVNDESIAFLQKPFTPESLAQKVREVLDGVPEPEDGEPPGA